MSTPYAVEAPITLGPRDDERPTRPVLVALPYGTLPVLSYFKFRSGLPAPEAREMLNAMRAELRKNGPTDGLRDALALCGFTWHAAPSIPDAKFQEAIDAVAAALDKPTPAESLVAAVLRVSAEEEAKALSSRLRGEGLNGDPADDVALAVTEPDDTCATCDGAGRIAVDPYGDTEPCGECRGER